MLPYCFIIITVLRVEMKGIESMLIDGNNVENAFYLLNFF